jgi:tRNA threonylcarbamoyladenosine biosynthesis protein TsaE
MNQIHSKQSYQQVLQTERASQAFAEQLAQSLMPGLLLSFSGDLGAGKTTIIRAMLRALGIQSAIKSPTYSLIETYHCPLFDVHHFDLYRIQEEYELDYLGFRDFFTENAVCCIEWPEKAGENLPEVDLSIQLSIYGNGRQLLIQSLTAKGNEILNCLEGEK